MLLTNVQRPRRVHYYKAVDRYAPDIHQTKEREVARALEQLKKRLKLRPLIVKSHHLYIDEYSDRRCIYIYRDPRDVAVSYYHYRWQHLKGLTFPQFLDKFVAGDVLFRSWKAHVRCWLFSDIISVKAGIEFLAVKYEDLLRNPEEWLRKVLDFIGMKADDRIVRRAVERTRFDKVKIHGAIDGQHPKLIGLRGIAGGWKKDFTAEMREKMLNWAGETMEKLGYKED